jgi:hypothetical protein
MLDKLDRFIHPERYQDEPVDRPAGVIRRNEWPYLVSPVARDYRIVEFENKPFHHYHMQAECGGQWVDVVVYEDGYDDYGKLSSGKWEPIGDQANWKLAELRALRTELLGIPEVPKVIE